MSEDLPSTEFVERFDEAFGSAYRFTPRGGAELLSSWHEAQKGRILIFVRRGNVALVGAVQHESLTLACDERGVSIRPKNKLP